MNRLYALFLRLIGRSGDSELARQVEFLKAQLDLYRERHGPLRLTDEEKRKIVTLGTAIGAGIATLLTIVSYSTFRKWVRTFGQAAAASVEQQRAVGRPETPDQIRELVLTLARNNCWGYTRILGELTKLGVKTSRSNVVNILRDAGVDPQPRRGVETWAGFVRAHAETLWQCDFFSRHVVTLTGIRQCFVLVFLHVATRRVFLTPCAFKPTAEWMKAQAQAFIEYAKAQNLPVSFLIRDNDGVYCQRARRIDPPASAQI